MHLTLVRKEEDASGTNGQITIEGMPGIVFLTIEKPWRGNLPEVSRIPPKLHYRLVVQEGQLHIVTVKGNAPLKGREGEEIRIMPGRDAASLPGGSVGIVQLHTALGRGFAPDAPYASLFDLVSGAMVADQIILLEIRA